MKIYVVTIIIECFPDMKFFQTLDGALDYMKSLIKHEVGLDSVSIKPVFIEDD